MLIDSLVYPLKAAPEVQQAWNLLDCGNDATIAMASSARPFMTAARFAAYPQPTLVVVPGADAAVDFARNVGAYVGEERVLLYVDRLDTPYGQVQPDAAACARRMQAAWALQSGRNVIVVASARSIVRCIPKPDDGVARPLDFRSGSEVSVCDHPLLTDYESVPRALDALGYVNTIDSLEGPGTYCVRGGTIDVFPGNLPYPVRLDFFGDEIDEIRRIVPTTGQTIASLDNVSVFAVHEYILDARGGARARKALANPARTNPALRELLDGLADGVGGPGADALLPYLHDDVVTLGAYLPDDALTVIAEPRALIDDATHFYEDIEARAKGTGFGLEGLYEAPTKLNFGPCPRCTFVSIMSVGDNTDAEIPVKRADVAGNPDKLFGRLRSLVDQDYTVVFSAPNYRARQDMKLAFVDNGLPITEVLDLGVNDEDAQAGSKGHKKPPLALKRGVVNVVDVDIPLGIIIPKARIGLISISDTQGSASVRTSRHVDITQVTFPYTPGDYVVHAAHGVALFKELVRREVGGVLRDYLLLEYASDDKLYVPVEQLDRVTRYVGPEGSSPRLTRLNTSDWSRAMGKARKASKKLAFDLVDVYTRRAATQGFRYGPDTPWQMQMEDAFPYDETRDQLAAIADIKADMQSARPMDRLVCGDVGFGKTEVAMRAAFKAVQAGKQVMILCPTTILAQQHFTTFSERFAPFDVQVQVLSRFRTNAQIKEALEGFADGTVQVLVGTHRLLSRDVNPHDLGLVIIDEEQRFGVGHKEQMKNLRESIDVLTLSATPIPRTMQMSMSGVRDMSLILTPPSERRPVEVHVGEWDPDVVSGAIRRELARGGQVYYVSNRVRSIDEAVSRVQAAAGEARVGVAHGKMSREELEHVMEDFTAGQLDVLVATTIIESGIDNPHTNTLIIEDSQRLGLAQMYQLKGRVGRSARQAYAYFLFPEHLALTEEALARLTALNEHTDLGSGMRIAMRDLEIRGAGSLLGAEQHGNMSAVGFDLFAQMLSEAVNATREGTVEKADLLPPALSDITVNVPVHAYVPEEYIADADARVLLYRKVASADEVEVIDDIQKDTQKRYGDMPAATQNFFDRARVKARANTMGIQTISVVAGKVNIDPVAAPERELMSELRRSATRYVKQTKKLQVPLKYFNVEEDESLLMAIYELLGRLAS